MVDSVSLFDEQTSKQACQPEEVTPELRLEHIGWI